MHLLEQIFLAENIDVPTDGLDGDVEFFGHVGDGYLASLDGMLVDQSLSFGCQHNFVFLSGKYGGAVASVNIITNKSQKVNNFCILFLTFFDFGASR